MELLIPRRKEKNTHAHRKKRGHNGRRYQNQPESRGLRRLFDGTGCVSAIDGNGECIVNQEVFIPLKINIRKGRAAIVVKPKDYFANTPLSRLLAKAEILESQLIKSAENGFTLKEFCEINKISPRYVRSIVGVNCLSPKIKAMIMDGNDILKHLTVEKVKNHGFSVVWKEQEKTLVFAKNLSLI